MSSDKTKILIVEDEQIVSMHLQDMLEGFNYEVLDCISTGEEVLSFFEKSDVKPDLILMDIKLDGEIDGVETVVELRKNNNNCPIIYLTANSDKATLARVKETRPIAFIQKPLDPNKVEAVIEIAYHKTIIEREYKEKLEYANKMNEMQIAELTETQQHLINATWRERELKEELQETKKLVEQQNKNILDSINYAKRIQKAILPTEQDLKNALDDYFMFYKPKDVVSGDFPWLFVEKNYLYIAAVDCTGHGVPGAMMSLIGHLILNEIVSKNDITPGEILNQLHKKLVKTLKQDEPENKGSDGMDVAMCRIDRTNSEVVYSGAHRPLYFLKNDELTQVKGDKFPIGGMQYSGKNAFTDTYLKVEPGNSIYFFSDGFPDQFGGADNKKYGPKRIRTQIVEAKNKTMEEQGEYFKSNFDSWMSNNNQIDDVLMLGIKF